MKIPASKRTYETRHEMRGGAGDIEIAHITKELPANFRMLSEITVDPGCSIGYHAHEGEAEVFYILEGTVVMSDNGEKSVFSQGDTCITSGASHSVENTSGAPAKILAFIITE